MEKYVRNKILCHYLDYTYAPCKAFGSNLTILDSYFKLKFKKVWVILDQLV